MFSCELPRLLSALVSMRRETCLGKCRNSLIATVQNNKMLGHTVPLLLPVDIDECGTGRHSCANDTICFNLDGGYDCRCPHGKNCTGDCVHDGKVKHNGQIWVLENDRCSVCSCQVGMNERICLGCNFHTFEVFGLTSVDKCVQPFNQNDSYYNRAFPLMQILTRSFLANLFPPTLPGIRPTQLPIK